MTAATLSTRLVRHFRQTLHASPERVFPLLCPVREKEWLPGFDARMIHSASGLAEPGAVFATSQEHGADVIWIVAAHRPAQHLQFVRWHPGEMVVDLALDLSGPRPDTTWLDIRYTYTAISPAGQARIEVMTEAQWLEQMAHWESSLNAWLAQHRD